MDAPCSICEGSASGLQEHGKTKQEGSNEIWAISATVVSAQGKSARDTGGDFGLYAGAAVYDVYHAGQLDIRAADADAGHDEGRDVSH